jgi:hypothetical protein
MQNYNFACCFMWLRKLVAHIEGWTGVEGFRELSSEKDFLA